MPPRRRATVATVHKGVPWKDDAVMDSNERNGRNDETRDQDKLLFDRLVNPVYFNDWHFCSLDPHLEKTIKIITYDGQNSHAVSTTPVLRVCTCHVIKKL